MIIFFFSSRRRHTRSKRDWSSDVCSSDLNMYDYNERDKVHSVNNVSPTLNTMQGGDRQPKVAVLGNTPKQSYTVAEQVAQTLQAGEVNQGVIIDDTQGYDGIRTYDGISPTLRSSRSGLKTIVTPKEESGEVNQGVVMGDKNIRFTDDGFHTHRNDKKKSSIQGTHVTYKEGKTHALTSNHVPMTLNNLRIRKLTPLECWRLQGFADEQFYKAKNSGVSNSQLYKQAGNGVSVPVVDAIVKCL